MTARPRRVAVTGSHGQLGAAMVERFQAGGYHVLPFTHRDLDLTDHRHAEAALVAALPDVIINCAADTDVDGAETHAARALEVNGFAVGLLARVARDVGATLLQFSTDFVFDGRSGVPYTEQDATNPRNTYALSKLLGEWFATEVSLHYVLRVESLFGGPAVLSSPRRSSIDRIADAIAEGRECHALVDRTVSPSYTVDLAEAAHAFVDRRPEPGLYHCVNSGHCTWHELALEIQRRLGKAATITPVSMRDVKLAAERPAFAALSNEKLTAAGIRMPTWQNALSRYLAVRFPMSP